MRIYQINTWPWLSELSERFGAAITLDTIPETEWDSLRALGFDAVWLMGVWQRSPEGRSIAQEHPAILVECARVLPGFSPARDIVGSPYCIHDYVVDAHLGGPDALRNARQRLRARGLKLLLDYVPNHTAPDHPWLVAGEDCYVLGTDEDARRAPGRFFRRGDRIVAHGAASQSAGDAWSDTAQLNAFSPRCRELTVDALIRIGGQCDGVRCDMAHLLRSGVFQNNWGSAVGRDRGTEFWRDVIHAVHRRHPEMIFLAEAYGNNEWELLQDGFTYCYDKEKFYDRLRASDLAGLRAHLQGAPPDFLRRLVHFISNHDEDPAAEAFSPPARHRMAAVALATVPGPSLWYYQQLDGYWGRQLVQLGTSVSVRSFYQRLLVASNRPAIRQGRWQLCPVTQAPAMLAYCWEHGEDRVVIVLNMSEDENAWGGVTVPWKCLAGHRWATRDVLSGEYYEHRGDDMAEGRMFVRPLPWGANIFEVTRI